MDQFVLWDNSQIPYKTVKEFVDAAKTANPPFKMGGTGSRREDQVLTVFMEKKTGAKFAYLPYKSGGEAATQLVGNHTGQRQQSVGEPRGLARRTGARAMRVRQGAHRVQDQGHGHHVVERHPDLQGTGPRHGVPDAARHVPARQGGAGRRRRSTSTSSSKLAQTPEYKDYMEKQALKPVFLTGKEMVTFLEEDDTLNKGLMTEAGFVATK